MDDSLYNRKRQDRAYTLSILSLIGFFIPFLGLLLALLSLGISSGVETHTSRMEKRRKSITIISTVAIVLSLIASFGWYKYYAHQQEEARNQAKSQQQAENLKEELKRLAESQKQADLNACLDNVNTWYAQNSQGWHEYEYWNQLNSLKAQQVQECQLRHQ